MLLGPLYYLADQSTPLGQAWDTIILPGLIASAAFALVSSSMYVVNDLVDREQDRAHPRKRHRPLASGEISPKTGIVFSVCLAIAGLALVALLPVHAIGWTLFALVAYLINVLAYSWGIKRHAIADVMGLSIGFVIRVLAGCAAAGVEPTTFLLNSTLFLAMFLAFGKRLGERRTMGDQVASARKVQQRYTDDLLRMAVVVTAVATLLTYAAYTGEKADRYTLGFNLLWLTMLPATYGLLRVIVLLERGVYDDPTELAVRDRPFQLAAAIFGLIVVVLAVLAREGGGAIGGLRGGV
ncbi:MAG: UbiA prenyltransferase family protein [Planctomycetota bacterium]